MGLFLKKAVSSALDKGKLYAGYLVIAVCILLIIGNICGFMFFPKLAAPLAVVLSNVVTILLMLLAYRPLSSLLQQAFSDKAHELVESEKEENRLQEQVSQLQALNQDLESKLQVREQMSGTPSELKFTFKLETVQFGKKGYVVLEQPLDELMEDSRFALLQDKSWLGRFSQWADSVTHPGNRKVLFIDKYYFMVTIGIDFRKIKYSITGDSVCFYGVRFSKLHNITEDMPRDAGDISHCWLVNEQGSEVNINQSPLYDEFLREYRSYQRQRTREELDGEVDHFCERYTEAFRGKLLDLFPSLTFCDAIEDSDATWYSLSDAESDWRIRAIAAKMMMLSTAVEMTSNIGPFSPVRQLEE